MTIPEKFDPIRPFNDDEVKQAFYELIEDRQFSRLIKGYLPWLPKYVRGGALKMVFKLSGVKTLLDFQVKFMKPVVEAVIKRSMTDIKFGGRPSPDVKGRYTFVSNHRDIVLDSALLDVLLIKNGHETTVEIAIGDNLLIYPWIEKLVRLNKAFIVRRSLTPREMYKSSQLMSEYIHFAVNQKRENIWIAQREGRAKDSSDHTQASVLKMLAMGVGEDVSLVDSLKDLHIVPTTISYEYDPCDYLKAKEFQLKRDNPKYRKSRQDDLDNMKTGIMGFKGHVVYECAPCINEWLDDLEGLPSGYFFDEVARRMDKEIHKGYHLFPGNYIALDILEGTRAHSAHYTSEDEATFDKYIAGQLAKIDIPCKDEPFLRERLLTMYANPVRNQEEAKK
ncbi:MAG: 1-acyl-sn-glycerol-3-phosphate acyltransferase [Bacteroidales bacterium]|nr:1-acyl-sn-glycerol-3-phosphate acyltransferase [Bacteroidales bacterium]